MHPATWLQSLLVGSWVDRPFVAAARSAGRSRLGGMKPLACVRFQASAPLGLIQDVLAENEVEWHYLDMWEHPSIPRVSELGGLVVLGGEMNADAVESYPFLTTASDLVRDAVTSELPVLAICLGAQLLTRSQGGTVQRAPHRELGFLPVKATAEGMDDYVLEPFSPATRVFQFHEDECRLPEGPQLLFEGADVRVQAFRVGQRAYGVQFHFEVTDKEIEAWCDETPDLEASWGADKQAVMEQAGKYLADQQTAGREVARRFVSLIQ
jgi:GMP synthase (glutamine-hydrolysing)